MKPLGDKQDAMIMDNRRYTVFIRPSRVLHGSAAGIEALGPGRFVAIAANERPRGHESRVFLGAMESGRNWKYICFRAENEITKGRLNIQALLEYLTETDIIPENPYLASLKYGNEAVKGSGSSILTRYTVKLETK